MTVDGYRKIVLSLPGVEERSHMGHPDFRVGGKIFATLPAEDSPFGVLLLTPEGQAGMVQDAPEIFSPVPGGWGKKGSTRVLLSKVKPDILRAALRAAWLRRAPKELLAKPKAKGLAHQDSSGPGRGASGRRSSRG